MKMDKEYVDIEIGDILLPIYIANIDLRYWSGEGGGIVIRRWGVSLY